jgi:hypothetical protein
MIKILLFLSFSTVIFGQTQTVGINTTSTPQQNLHIGTPNGTIRVDGLNATNNPNNGGGMDKSYPLYVNNNGDLTLNLQTQQNSNGIDFITSLTTPGPTDLSMPTTATLPNNGYRSVILYTYPITVSKPSVLEIKYNISFDILFNFTSKLKDLEARNISTYWTLDNAYSNTAYTVGEVRYGQSSKCYHNNNLDIASANCASGTIFNSASTYISLPTGSHTLRLVGLVTTGPTNQETVVRFGTGNDQIFMKLY